MALTVKNTHLLQSIRQGAIFPTVGYSFTPEFLVIGAGLMYDYGLPRWVLV